MVSRYSKIEPMPVNPTVDFRYDDPVMTGIFSFVQKHFDDAEVVVSGAFKGEGNNQAPFHEDNEST